MKIIEHPELKFRPMNYVKKEEKKYIVTHHPEAKKYSPAQIHNQHLGQNWSGAGYNFYIRKDGTVHRLRPTLAVGCHCPGHNRDGIGVCWEGNYQIETVMPHVQFQAGVELYKYLMKEYSIPLGKVIRHCDARPTNCPGKNFPWKSLISALSGQKKTEIPSEVLTPICGKIGVTKEQVIQHINGINKDCKIGCKLSEWVDFYFEFCGKYNIKAEIAIAQALFETNYLRFGNIVQPHQNNYAGLGALDKNAKGQAASFASPGEGVMAHVQHLVAYATTAYVESIVDPRFGLVNRGSAPYLEYLSIPRNPRGVGWASDKDYAIKIKSIIHKINGTKVQKEHWGTPFIKELQNKEIISEWHDPDSTVTWAELSAVLAKVGK